MSNFVVKVNPVEVLSLQKEGGDILINPEAEDSIIKLLDIQKKVNEVVDNLKAKIEEQALEFNPDFSSIKGTRLKINYSASGAKYKDDGTVKARRVKFWNKKISWSINSKAVDEYRARRHALPIGIVDVPRKKTIRFSVSEAENE
jgi:hypothetical protein